MKQLKELRTELVGDVHLFQLRFRQYVSANVDASTAHVVLFKMDMLVHHLVHFQESDDGVAVQVH